MMYYSLTTILLLLQASIAWKLPHSAFGNFESHRDQRQTSLTSDDEVDAFGASSFAGLRTFANLPYVDCFSAQGIRDHLYDIAIFGAPHDTVISGRPAANSSVSSTPRILTLGGDHTTTLSALRSTYQRWGPVSVIHFDSHIDTWDPAVLGGGISDYANDARCGFEIITARDLDKFGSAGVISKIKERVGDSKVYISVDIDVLDPAYAPATGTAEPGGWSTRELLTVLDGLEGLSIVGADVVEVAPAYDNHGETTVLAAAEVAYSLIDLMVLTPVQSKADVAKAR
ncbi:putative arginase [Colletotrichum sublineola]|uniref:Putative arginase n=1 Tax=Colletotrichum sublineola TaxID=1173701 RepID=A0A066WZ07_COLSU|nr:putative arginase [Colletotrichum sublineola]